MKISPQWLRDYVDLRVDYRTLADALTLAGIAVEEKEVVCLKRDVRQSQACSVCLFCPQRTNTNRPTHKRKLNLRQYHRF